MIVLIPAYEPDEPRWSPSSPRSGAADPDAASSSSTTAAARPTAPSSPPSARWAPRCSRHPVNRGKGAALKTGFALHRRDRPRARRRLRRLRRPAPRRRHRCAWPSGVRDAPRRDGARRAPVHRRRARCAAGSATRVTRALFRLATGPATSHDTQTGLRGYPAVDARLAADGRRRPVRVRAATCCCARRRAGVAVDEVEIETVYLDDNASSHFRPVVDSVRVYAPLLRFSLSSFAAFVVDTVALLRPARAHRLAAPVRASARVP